MKKLLIIVLALFNTIALKAQVITIDEFTLSETKETYGIYADIDCDESVAIYFDMQASHDQQLEIKLLGKNIEGFIQSLQSAQKEYNEWSKIAQNHNVTSLSKTVNSSFSDKDICYFNNGNWFEEKSNLNCKFLVSSNGSCFLVLKCSRASLTFSSSEEIDMFIQKLQDAKQWKQTNKEQGKLFKSTIIHPYPYTGG